MNALPILLLLAFALATVAFAQVELARSGENCGPSADGRRCAAGLCCSKYGFCGTTENYCGPGQCLENFGRCGLAAASPLLPLVPTMTASDTTFTTTVTLAPTNAVVVDLSTGLVSTSDMATILATIEILNRTVTSLNGRINYCGPAYNNRMCGGNECCSLIGVCGASNEFCSACFPKYGNCRNDIRTVVNVLYDNDFTVPGVNATTSQELLLNYLNFITGGNFTTVSAEMLNTELEAFSGGMATAGVLFMTALVVAMGTAMLL